MAYFSKYLNYFLRDISNRVKWGYFIFFVTNKCNSKCKHCFYWKNLNSKSRELNLNEINEISKKTGGIEVLLLSGGEPFLRKDLFEIISLFIKNNKVKVVSIPTNAILTDKIIDITKKLAESYPKITFSINLSIDNLYSKNDIIRGVKGCFRKSIKALERLQKLKRINKNLEIVVNTTISNSNYKNIQNIIKFFKKFDITYHNFELLRGSPKEKNFNLPRIEEIKKIHAKAINAREYYINKNKSGNFLTNLFEKIYVLGIMKYSQTIKEKVLQKQDLPFICSAGKNIIVLEPEGDIRLCEQLPRIGNLRDYNYNIIDLLKSASAKKMIKTIKKCKCTHACFLNMSIARDKKSLIKVPYYFIKWKK
jgi:MoaA/NifB/PqqE/SkfB family radical SAM enzyme